MRCGLIRTLCVFCGLVLLGSGCGGASGDKKMTNELNNTPLEEIVEKAKAEGELQSVAMPDDWANWGDTWEQYSAEYGIGHTDTDMSSAEELAMFAAEKDSPTKDIGDVGPNFALSGKEQGLLQAYKTSYWDGVPDWARDEEGYWMIAYSGVSTFLTNNNQIASPPKSWQEVRNGDFKITAGDVVGGATAQATILATAYAFGGGMENLDPAFDFWKEMARAGRIDPGEINLARIQSGEIAFVTSWCYNTYGWRDATPEYEFTVSVPTDGSVRVGYASIINAYAPHPFAAALARETIFSDKGQINLAKGYAIPTRSDVVIPAEIAGKGLAQEDYQDAVIITDYEQYTDVCTEISRRWQEEIIPLLGK